VTSNIQQQQSIRRIPAADPIRQPQGQHSSARTQRPDIEHYDDEFEDVDMERFDDLDVEGTRGDKSAANRSGYGIGGRSALFDDGSEEEDFEKIRRAHNRRRLQKESAQQRFALSAPNVHKTSMPNIVIPPPQHHMQSSDTSLVPKTRTPPTLGLTTDQRSWLSPQGQCQTSIHSLGPGTELIPRNQQYNTVVQNFNSIVPNAHSPSRNATVKFLRAVRVVPLLSPSVMHQIFLFFCKHYFFIFNFTLLLSFIHYLIHRLYFMLNIIYAYLMLLKTFVQNPTQHKVSAFLVYQSFRQDERQMAIEQQLNDIQSWITDRGLRLSKEHAAKIDGITKEALVTPPTLNIARVQSADFHVRSCFILFHFIFYF
jgi:hypothetical protein